ncbi:MAG: FecR domain-containing protein [Phycisphaeraceae bacterium]
MNRELVDVCLRYLDGELDAEELAAFERLIVKSPEAADVLSQLALDEEHYRATPYGIDAVDEASVDFAGLAGSDVSAGSEAWSSGLAGRLEADDSYRSTLRVVRDPGFWAFLAGSALRTRPAKWAACAAVLLCGVGLFVVLNGDSSERVGVPGVAAVPGAEARPGDREPLVLPADAIVATLTGGRDARWEGRVFSLGSGLRAGDRLTLVGGWAEITTGRGAIARIEGPCVVELKDNDNAVFLHAGRLVGVCETASSKGFVVGTPHMDVVDLGTRFGVEVTRGVGSEVHVFDGVVRAERAAIGSAAPQRQTLTAGQAIRANEDASDAMLVRIPATPHRFTQGTAKNTETTLRVGDTGGGLVSGDIDPDWQIVAVDGNPVTEDTEMTVWSHPDNEVDRADTKWVRVNNALNPAGAKSVVFTSRSIFELPDDVAAASHELIIRARADNKLAALRINGHALNVPKNRVGVGPEWLTWTLAEHLKPGPNTIEIDIDERLPDDNKFNSSGLIAELELQTR